MKGIKIFSKGDEVVRIERHKNDWWNLNQAHKGEIWITTHDVWSTDECMSITCVNENDPDNPHYCIVRPHTMDNFNLDEE